MPEDKDFKRLVRRRMRKTGESYAAARSRLGTRPGGPPAAQPPFERLTARARLALAFARDEAEARWSPEIGTDHLLLGLVVGDNGVAARALRTAGVDRSAVAGALGGARPAPAQAAPLPVVASASLRRALEVAFLEARAMGDPFVGTEHLLLGVILAAESAGARVLDALGVGAERVRGEVERARRSTVAGRPPDRLWNKPRSNEVEWVLEEALRRALDDDRAVVVGLDHVVAALAAHPSGEALLAGLRTRPSDP
jgi:ATP-dependent Clp protease ATP-binding subunit ClpA